jgi:hypothetical protein
MLFNNSTIRTYFAALILVVFAYSITPKIVLHNLVANHIDKSKVLNNDITELSASGFNCKCDNLVAESPFVPGEAIAYNSVSFIDSIYVLPTVAISTYAKTFSKLRGPPLG